MIAHTILGSPLPRPVLPQHRTIFDRLVDYLVGDGPSNRYALICRQCEFHNGMALKEEFEYFGKQEVLSQNSFKNMSVINGSIRNIFFIAYRCCYCGFWNPARKQKPSAPKLDFESNTNNTTVNASSPEEAESHNDGEESVKLNELETCTQSDTGKSDFCLFFCINTCVLVT